MPSLQASVLVVGDLKCLLQLSESRPPIGGPLAFFVGGVAPVGVGLELEREAAPTTFKVGGQTEIGPNMSADWNCLAGFESLRPIKD